MTTADYKDIRICSFHLLIVTLQLKENDGLYTNHF